jgi:uncharacterized phage protein (TIGR02218 family)
MTNTIDSAPNKTYVTLLTFQYASTEKHYAAYDSDVTIDTITYTAVPELEIHNLSFGSFFDSATINLKVPLSVLPVSDIVSGLPFPKTTVLIDEVNVDDLTSKRALLKAQVVSAVKNVGTGSNLVTLKLKTQKNLLDIPSSIPAMATCPWDFGDTNCGKNLNALRFTANITNISGFVITIDTGGLDTTYLHRGSIEKDGVRLLVRIANANVLTMIKLPPLSWVVGSQVTVYPGCDKTLTTCRNKWSNELNFAGVGIAMPSYNPILERGS